jgi:hypothetical protein
MRRHGKFGISRGNLAPAQRVMPGGAVVFGTVRGHRVDNASRPSRPLTVMGESVRVQVNRIGDLAEADRYLDAMEQGSASEESRTRADGCTWSRPWTSSPRINQIIDHLPQGWQDHLVFQP